MNALNKSVLKWTADHHTVITTDDLARLGVTRSQRRQLVDDGLLERVLDGSYRFPGSPNDELARCVAACSRGLIVAGPTAGRLSGFRRMPRDWRVYVIAPPASNPSVEKWLRPYRTAMLDPLHITQRCDGIRLTSPPRTVVDLSRYLPNNDLLSVIDQVESEGMATAQMMWQVAADLATPGRPWARRCLRILEQRPQHGVPESHWESRVVAALVDRGIRDLEPQRRLDVPGWGPIRLDGSVARLRWGVEVDVYPTHFTEEGGSNDRERDLACDAIGWRVSRVARPALKRNFDLAIDRLVKVYEQRCREQGSVDTTR
ncbi:MAG: type IV toxin-antitoxin system AbiEi family antitoxin domain-containing protein [Ilumatobacteraceae bacterium]